MSRNRRSFLKRAAGVGALTVLGNTENAQAAHGEVNPNQLGVLVDTTRCVGCRRCEEACNETNSVYGDLPARPAEDFQGDAVFDRYRRMDYRAYTVVNRHEHAQDPEQSTYAKIQCMHCLQPACVSACIVGALSKEPNGEVIYDASKCIGCRYCMMACPFQVPAYEYNNTLTPQVRKCTFCFEAREANGGAPACVRACPMQVMTFGKRDAMLRVARQRLRNHPDRYVPYIYGEKEVGGTAWMYLSDIPFDQLRLPKFGYHPVPGYTEPIQHALFKWFLPPAALYTTLGGIMWFINSRKKQAKSASGKEGEA